MFVKENKKGFRRADNYFVLYFIYIFFSASLRGFSAFSAFCFINYLGGLQL